MFSNVAGEEIEIAPRGRVTSTYPREMPIRMNVRKMEGIAIDAVVGFIDPLNTLYVASSLRIRKLFSNTWIIYD
jgi:hypothetical protein